MPTASTSQQPATATDLWQRLHAREVAAGKSPLAATKAIDRQHPGLREEMNAEATAAAAARRRR